jgi:hypothetical protein
MVPEEVTGYCRLPVPVLSIVIEPEPVVPVVPAVAAAVPVSSRLPVPVDGYSSLTVAAADNAKDPEPVVTNVVAETPNSSEATVNFPSADGGVSVALSNVAAEKVFSGPSPNCQKLTATSG